MAIVHFNCSDQFMLNVDDITLHRTYDAVAENNAMVTVYPNPAANRLTVNSDSRVESYEVYSITGAMVRRQEAGSTTFDIDVRDLPVGTYLLKLNSEGQVQTQRFVKR